MKTSLSIAQSEQASLLTFDEFCKCVVDYVEIEIRTKSPGSEWKRINYGRPAETIIYGFSDSKYEYRHAPPYQPWTEYTCPPVLSILHDSESHACAIIKITNGGLYIGGSGFMSFKEIFDSYWTFDGKRCGSIVENLFKTGE